MYVVYENVLEQKFCNRLLNEGDITPKKFYPQILLFFTIITNSIYLYLSHIILLIHTLVFYHKYKGPVEITFLK